MAEFAIALPLLLLLLVAIVDFGLYLYDTIGVQAGLRAASQVAIQANTAGLAVYPDAQIRRLVREAHGPINPILDEEVTIVRQAADPAFGGQFTSVTISINHRHSFMFPAFMLGGREFLQITASLKSIMVPGFAP
jgi:hypothetical protein